MKIYSIDFNTKTFNIEANLCEIMYTDLDEQYDKLVELLNSNGLDVQDYNKEIAILVDDRGFEKTNNPVFEVITEDNLTLQFAGKILFVRNIYNEDSTDFGSITSEDVYYLKNNLQIKVIGILKNTL